MNISNIISFVSLIISLFILWDTYFHEKIKLFIGRQGKLFVANINEDGRIFNKPTIQAIISISNYGGKLTSIEFFKLRTTLVKNNQKMWTKDFEAIREYDTILGDGENINQTELILPISILARSNEIKRLIFCSTEVISSQSIPGSFDLEYELMTEQGGKWKSFGKFHTKNISGIWLDLENDKYKYSNILIFPGSI